MDRENEAYLTLRGTIAEAERNVMVSYNDVFDALAAGHRRQLLVKLLSSPHYVSKPAGISREIAQADENLLQRHLSSSRTIAEADEYAISMHHVHLPKLAEYGFIEWHRDDNLVAQGPRFDEIRPHLRLVAEQQDERRRKGLVVTPRR